MPRGVVELMEITPPAAAGRQVVQRYGGGGFQISGRMVQGSVLVFPTRTLPWPVDDASGITAASLATIVEAAAEVDILLIGCGARSVPLAPGMLQALRAQGITTDAMDTGAACRTFNVLVAEDRRVAAALIAIA